MEPASPKSATVLAHELVSQHLRQGDTAVDATVGNGHDTLFLCGCVGPEGSVIGFDLQEEALASARLRLEDCPQAELHQTGHERLAEVVSKPIRAVMFNLGYLPGSDKTVVTLPGTTRAALTQALELLAPGGIVTLVIYRGHPGGQEEAASVEAFCEALATTSADRYQILRYEPSQRGKHPPPYLIAIERTDKSDQ